MSRVFGIPAYAVRFGGRPGIWISRFLEPLVALPILTLWLWRKGESWRGLGLRRPANWRRFSWHVLIATIALPAVVFAFMYGVIYPFHFTIASPPSIPDLPTF